MEMVKSVSIQALVMRRDAFKEQAEKAQAAMDAARAIYDETRIGDFGDYDEVGFEQLAAHEFCPSPSKSRPGAESWVKGFDATAWRHLMRESGLQTFMSSKDIAEWESAIRAKLTPEFTVSNIEATFAKLHADRGLMLERGVLSLFKELSWDYASNNPVKFGKRIVMKGSLHSSFIPREMAQSIDDLNRFMHVADGAAQPDHRQNFAMTMAHRAAADAGGFASPYFKVVGFKNGNLHIVFARPDLVEAMNRMLASTHPNALPAPH